MSIQITFTVQTTEEAEALLRRYSGTSGDSKSTEEVARSATRSSESSESTNTSSAPSRQETPDDTEQSSTILVSATVRKYAEDNGVDVTTIKGTGKDGRILKKDVTAAVQASAPPASTATENDTAAADDLDIDEGDDDDLDLFDLDDENEAPPAATKEDVRKALVTLQSAVRDKLIASGEEEAEAKRKAMDKARGFLKKISGSDTLASLEEDKYQSVVERAEAQIAKLTK